MKEHTCVSKYKADLSGTSTRNSKSYKQCNLYSIINKTELVLHFRQPEEIYRKYEDCPTEVQTNC